MFKLLALSLLSSCAFFVSQIDNPIQQDPELLKKAPEIQRFCKEEPNPHFQLVGTSENSQQIYFDLTKGIKDLDFIDHFALWNLFQLSLRPDQSSASSRLQVLVRHQSKTHYYDFFSESSENQYPYLYGIEWVLKRYGKNKKLEDYGKLLSKKIAGKVKINKEFELFLLKNSVAIKTDPSLTPYYFRGNDVLKENETSPILDYAKLFKIYRESKQSQKIIVNMSLTKFVTEKGSTGSCNYDFNLYDNSIFLIDKAIPIANLYGLSHDRSAFLATSSQKLDKISSLHGLPLFKGESRVRSSAVCMIENKKNVIWAFSNQSRDPGQHLFHLVRYGLPSSTSSEEVDKLIKHSRHLFLSDPVRLVIESSRSSEEQVKNLLKLSLPIYNAEKIGNIWAYTQFENENHFIVDDRNPGSFLCR